MNKRIYFNQNFLEFAGNITQAPTNQLIRIIDEISEKELKKLINELLSETTLPPGEKKVVATLNINKFDYVVDYLKKNYYYIEAAGGLIKKGNDFLFILRFGKWDLPKGKLEPGESVQHAAIRECEEECAIQELTITSPLTSTFHLYKYKNSFAFKQTFWFNMESTYSKDLKPQTEEHIEQVEWFTTDQIKKTVLSNTYLTIRDVINEALAI